MKQKINEDVNKSFEQFMAEAAACTKKSSKNFKGELVDELKEKLGLWDRIHAKRKRGERPAKPGEKDYPKTLNVEGLDMKTFKSNRAKAVTKAATKDARDRGHEGHEWHNTGRTYSPDEAKSRRANMSDDDRAARHRVAVDPDDDRDENTYSADKTKNPKKLRKQKAMGEEYDEMFDIYEAEGSYGKTPESTKRWNKATLSRMHKPASGYPNRGDKKKEVAKYSKHNQRTMSLQHDASRGPGKKSSRGVGGRQGLKMTQQDRDDARGQAEYGHTGYDPSFDGPPSSPGSKPKGKKLERQKKTGVSAESFDIYDIILSHLLDEGKVELKQRNKNEMQRKAGNLGREVVSTPNTKKNAAKRGAAMDRMKKLVSVIARDDEEKRFKTIGQSPLHNSYETEGDQLDEVAAWQRSEGKNKSGGLNEKGRKSYERDNPGSDLKAPSKKVGNPRRKSFCARMRGMKSKLTSAKTARDPDSRINKSLRAWNC